MKLVLVRHAKAVENFDGPDALRELTPTGRQEFAPVAALLAKRIKSFDVAFASPYDRAQQTAQILTNSIPATHSFSIDDATPESSPEDTLRSLKRYLGEIASPERVLLVGHEPNLSSLISLLLTGALRPMINVKRGSAHCISTQPSLRPGEGMLDFSIRPSLFKHV